MGKGKRGREGGQGLKVKDFDQTEHDHSGRVKKREGEEEEVYKEVVTWQTEARSLSRHRRHCKTTTTLDISFPVIFLSFTPYLTDRTGRWWIYYVFRVLCYIERSLHWFLLHFSLLFNQFALILKYIYLDFCSGRNGEIEVWAAESGFPRRSFQERAGGECLRSVDFLLNTPETF